MSQKLPFKIFSGENTGGGGGGGGGGFFFLQAAATATIMINKKIRFI